MNNSLKAEPLALDPRAIPKTLPGTCWLWTDELLMFIASLNWRSTGADFMVIVQCRASF